MEKNLLLAILFRYPSIKLAVTFAVRRAAHEPVYFFQEGTVS
jgi:hypothetical protein